MQPVPVAKARSSQSRRINELKILFLINQVKYTHMS